MFSDMSFKYGIVAVVVRVALSLASVVRSSRSVSVSSDEIFVIVVLGKNTVKVLVPFR